MTKLQHRDRVRLATWAHPYDRVTVEVGTARGYAAEYREDGEEAHQRALSRGHDTAYTVHVGSALLGSASARQAQREREDANLAQAVLLADGDEVEIEGEAFRVRVMPGNLTQVRNSDPIHFVRVV
jgi:hypothetical protein